MAELKKLLNLHEDATHLRLRRVCESWGANVYPKVRVADVLPIEGSGVSVEQFRYALRSHFDFIVTTAESSPLFAVEFDGPIHGSTRLARRDALKNHLCERFEFPLLRINSRYLPARYRQMDLLSWFVETWFMARAFEEAQEKGQIPWDEPFIPGSVLSIPGRKKPFPLWLSLDARADLQRLHEHGQCYQPVPSSAVAEDQVGNYRAIAYILTDPQHGVVAHTAMRCQRFPVVVSEVLDDIVVIELFERLKLALSGKARLTSARAIEKECQRFRSQFRLLTAGGYGESPLLSAREPLG